MENMHDTQFIQLPHGDEELEQVALTPEEVLEKVYGALKEKGYDPATQIVGYIISGDPTYITNHNSARSLIRKVERDELLSVLVEHYIETKL